MKKILLKSNLRFLMRHPWQFGLSVLGIAMGIALVVAIDLANQSALTAFNLSMDAVAGKSTHSITSASDYLPDSLYRQLRLEHGFRNSAPVIEKFVITENETKRTLTLLGVDFFAERNFRNYLSDLGENINTSLNDFLTMPDAVLMHEETARELNLTPGDKFPVKFDGMTKELKLLAALPDVNNRSSFENLIICDIAAAQEILSLNEKLSRIDLIIDNQDEFARLEAILPTYAILTSSDTRSGTAEQMLQAFNTNLTALSLLALLVGMFLIYNTVSFSVVQRKQIIGLLRIIGVTDREIFRMIIIEALLTGFLGTIIGVLIGIIIAGELVNLVSRSINDLYYVLNVRSLDIRTGIVVKAILLGIIASFLAAVKPAKEATDQEAITVLRRSDQEISLNSSLNKYAVIAAILLLLGTFIVFYPSRSIIQGYLGMLPVIAGFALLTPFIIKILSSVIIFLFGKFLSGTTKMALIGIGKNLSRTSVAVAALGLSVAAVIGVGTMITSFRGTVVQWLEQRLEADLFITAPALVSRKNDPSLNNSFLEDLSNNPKVTDINFYRESSALMNNRTVRLIAAQISERNYDSFSFKDRADSVWEKFYDPASVMISEPFAYKYNLELNDRITLRTPAGSDTFTVIAVYYDYASDEGMITMSYNNYMNIWNEKGISGISVFVEESTNLATVSDKIRNTAGDQEIIIRTNKFLRENSIEIFDRTFIIANVLQLLSVIVAFVGILSALMSLQLERRREIGILRANGFLQSEIWKLITLQTGIMGLIAGLIAVPLGNLLAAILVFIINKRSFGWTLRFELLPSVMIEAVLIAVLSALLAGIYPAYKMSRTLPATALREE